MAKSIRSKRKSKSDKPDKPFADFPLFLHQTRRWAKKIRGKTYYFGAWADPDAALQKYLDQKDDLFAGRTPRVGREGLTIRELANRFLTSKESLLKAGEIVQATFTDYHRTCARIVGAFGKDRLVSDLAVDDFEMLRGEMAEAWGPVRLGNEIQRIRVVFNYAYQNGLIDSPIRYGQGFKRPSRKTLRIERAKKGPRLFEAEEIRRMLDAATAPLKAMILLGVNCGFGNSDCANLPLSRLDLDGGFHNYARPKTGMKRRCPLWPETIEALRQVLAKRPKPLKDEHADLVFITQRGGTWAKDTSDNPVSKEMAKLLKALGIFGNRNFYALRHTFETVGGDSRDQVAVDTVMGHSRDDMASIYRERISDDRLKAVAGHVHDWLFSAVKKA
jgi:integrase